MSSEGSSRPLGALMMPYRHADLEVYLKGGFWGAGKMLAFVPCCTLRLRCLEKKGQAFKNFQELWF